jgi:hypothetical protein
VFCDWRRSARLAALAAVSASCLTVTACGLMNTGSAGGTATASASASASPDPLASVTGNTIATRAVANLKAASSVTIDGSFTDSGQAYTLDLKIKSAKGCAGSIGMGSKGSFKLIVIGKTLYFDPDDAFWKANAGSAADTVITLVNGRYIKSTTKGSVSQLAKLCDLNQVLTASFKIDGTLTKGKLTTLGGVKVLPLTQGTQGTMWVTDTAKPEVVKIEAPKDSSGTSGALTFSTSAPVTLTPPPASQVIEGSAVGVS